MEKTKHMRSAIEWDVPRTLCGIKIKKDMRTVENSLALSNEVSCKNCIRLIKLHGSYDFTTIPNPACEHW